MSRLDEIKETRAYLASTLDGAPMWPGEIKQAAEGIDWLIAEVERLRVVVFSAPFATNGGIDGNDHVECPFCFARGKWFPGQKRAFAHSPDCLAFTPSGEVK